ncbi:Uu.00g067260.m01.CDS01 [Anthostomella pinea]|uniref:Uu.00g067260.m01.CDS01 n=1 Tax=Anthostomella pinea TaxID=933095 RepID=A0AAI8VU49_9PEZI|nr:Uu.00g067260.m01.CDS01 [Anthostomella pinea]
MSSADDPSAAMIQLLTSYDNSHEPKPAWNNKSTAYGLIISSMVLSWICVALRLYTRFSLRCPGWDDLLVVLFRVSATIGTITICMSFENGLGEHFLTIGQTNMVEFQRKFYIALTTYSISTTLTKLCLLAQYLRVFEAGSVARKVSYGLLVVSGLWGIAFSICALAPCFPLSGFWNWTIKAKCYGFGSKVPAEISGSYAAHAASNVVLDILILAIPVPLYFSKATIWKQRLAVSCMAMLGLVISLLSVWRLQGIVEHKAATYPVMDPTWYAPQSLVLAGLEVDLCSICASIPVFWPVITGNLGKIFVTQEVHITRKHRRLSGGDEEDDARYELQPSASMQSQRSDEDLHLVMTDTMTSKGARERQQTGGGHGKGRSHYDDDFVANSVIPLGMNEAKPMSAAQIVSGGQRGFEHEQRERFGITPDRIRDEKTTRKYSR